MPRINVLHTTIGLSILAVLFLPVYTFLYLYPAFTKQIIRNREINAQQVATYLSALLDNAGTESTLRKEILTPEFTAMVRRATKDFNLVKVKMFSPAGEIIYSSDPQEIGKLNDHPYFLEVVAKGQKFTKVVTKNEKTAEEQVVSKDVVETYIPLLQGPRFIGAFEIYYDITASKIGLKRILSRSQYLLLGVTLSLLAAVLLTARKANHYLRKRIAAEQELLEINKELSVLFQLSTATSKTINLDLLLTTILETITRFDIFDLEAKGGIFLLEGNSLKLASHLGHDPYFLALHENLLVGQCLCGKAAQSGELIVSADCCTDPRHTIQTPQMSSHGHVIVPLKDSNKIVGVLYLYTKPGMVFGTRTQQLFKTIGAQVGIMVGNAILYEQTKALSLHDPLTGLANRRQLDMKLAKQITFANRYHKEFSVFMADIDYFKKYNDTYGHEMGDLLLQKVAAILLKVVRDSDLVARYGGEEFAIILPETTAEVAKEIASRICTLIAKETELTISIGIASYSQWLPADSLLKAADQALYHAKSRGRNQVVYADLGAEAGVVNATI